MSSVVKEWVAQLGLRHQGVLVSATRGCDAVDKDDPSKALVRAYRGVVLNPFSPKPSSFIQIVDAEELTRRFNAVRRSFDHYPVHFLLHLLHASEIVGYKHPEGGVRGLWHAFYLMMVHAMHFNIETQAELDHRLDLSEERFAAMVS